MEDRAKGFARSAIDLLKVCECRRFSEGLARGSFARYAASLARAISVARPMQAMIPNSLCDAVLSCASVLPSSVAFLRTLASKEELQHD